MRNRLLILSFTYFIVGCKNKEVIPENVLPPQKMQTVLWDMMRADQFLSDYVLNKDISLKKEIESIKLYQQIFTINHVTKEKFQTSFAFYQSHPSFLKIIMDSIANTTAARAAPVEIKNRVPVTDSLNNAISPLVKKDTTRFLKKRKKIRIQKGQGL